MTSMPVVPAYDSHSELDTDSDFRHRSSKNFDALNEIVRQMAAVILAASLGNRHFLSAQEMLSECHAGLAEIRDNLSAARPEGMLQEMHLHHLKRAAGFLDDALVRSDRLFQRSLSIVDPLPLVRAALEELCKAHASMPGLCIVDFGQGCCAEHMALFSQETS